MKRFLLALLLTLFALAAARGDMKKDDTLTLAEPVGKTWEDELVRYRLSFDQGQFPGGTLKLLDGQGREHPVQLSNVETWPGGWLKQATVSFVVTLRAGETKTWRMVPGKATAKTDLSVGRKGETVEVATAKTGARFRLGEKTFETPVPADQVPAPLQAIRLRSGKWGGRGSIETPHKCRSYKIELLEDGPVFALIGFRYVFDGFRKSGDIYSGTIRIAAGQELIEFDEEFSLGDPKTYSFMEFESRAQEIMWDWWQWMPHEARHNFVFSFYENLRPTRARWFGHNATVPEKRTGRNPTMDHETDYDLNFKQDGFDISINAYLRGCPDQAKSWMAWRAGDPNSDVVGIIGIRAVDWINPDMQPKKLKIIQQATDTSDLRIYSLKKPDLVVKAPLHLGRRAWGLVTLKMPDAGPTEPLREQDKIKKYAFQREASQCLRLQAKYGNRQLDKVKNWTLTWPGLKQYPSLFIKGGGIETIRMRLLSSPSVKASARKKRHKPVVRYLLDGGEKNARGAYADVENWCRRHIDILFNHGYCSHRGTNNNQYPWWMQEMSAQFDLVMGMPEISKQEKERLRVLFAFCVNMLQDDEFMPPRKCGYGWGSINMPINTRGGRAITAAALSDSPDAKAWLERAVEYLNVFVERTWSEDGVPVSCPHYTSTQAGPLMNMALPLYYAGVIPPLQKKFPRIANFTRHMIDRMAPPDIRCRRTRVLPTIGHTRMEYDSDIGKYALLMLTTNKRLAGEAKWMWKRGGEATHGFLDGIYYMHEDYLEIEPDLKSTIYPGFGVILRNGFPHENETYMIVRHGNHAIDHFDNDVGGFHLYAKGVPLCLDWSSMYQPNCRQTLWHNTLSWNVKEHARKQPALPRDDPRNFYHGKIWYDHQYRPHTLLDPAPDREDEDWTPYLGTTKGHALTDEVDYAMTSSTFRDFQLLPWFNKEEGNPSPWAPYTSFDRRRLKRDMVWQRRFIFVKDADLNGPNYFVIHDDLDGQDELTPQLNVWCLADNQRIEGNRVHWRGQYHVDLDLYVASPKEPRIGTRTWWHTERGPARPNFKNGREEQIAAHVKHSPGGDTFCVVLYPRGRYEIEPRFESSADGSAVKVGIGRRTDLIFVSREKREWDYEGVQCSGTVAVVKRHPEYTTLVLSEPGTLKVQDVSVEAGVPVSLRMRAAELSGQVFGKGAVTLKLPRSLSGKSVKMNRKRAGTVGPDGAVQIESKTSNTTIEIGN